MSFNKCGDKLVSAGYDCYLKLLDTETDNIVSRFVKDFPLCAVEALD